MRQKIPSSPDFSGEYVDLAKGLSDDVMKNANITICGAGVAGIATAYYLAVKYGERGVVLIDRHPPMSLTSSKSGENFRDYWPQPCMTALTSHSLDLMQKLADDNDDLFKMHFSGYDFVSESTGHDIFPSEHMEDHSGTGGLSRICSRRQILARNPCLAESIRQLVHIHRAGAMDVHALGMLLLSEAKRAGVVVLRATVSAIESRPAGFRLGLSGQAVPESLDTQSLVLAPGPFIKRLAGMLGISLRVETLLQRKFIIRDSLSIIPRNMPFTVFADPQYLSWSNEESELIKENPEYHHLLDEYPPGLHIKPEGLDKIKLGWAFNRKPEKPRWQTEDDFDFPNITLLGASRFIPALKAYVDEPPTPVVQFSGYYTRTAENLPLIGPLNEHGLFTVSALSGYGTMAACSAGELCADWVVSGDLPKYAPYFHPDRYQDSELMDKINGTDADGQL